jgi:RNA polymerase sigma-70 factor (ECF subfamily)
MAHDPSGACFPTTPWGRVLQAGDPAAPEARAALEALCRDYWFPLYAFVRRKGYDPDTAQDRVQGTFAELLAREDFRGLDPGRGRFRSLLMACCAHHLARHHDRERVAKRGGGRPLIAIDTLAAESHLGSEPAHDLTPERLFERRWALTLLDRVLAALVAAMARSGRPALYEQLRPCLNGQGTCPACLLRAGLPRESQSPSEPPAGPLDGAETGYHHAVPGVAPVGAGTVLETLEHSIGPIPRVLLPDTDTADASGIAVIQPSSSEMPAPAERGKSRDDPPPDEPARAALRQQALGWLKAEHAAWAQVLDTGAPQTRAMITQKLKHWQQDPDLAGVRDAEDLARLPEEEQKAWRELWSDVATQLKNAGSNAR